MASVLIGGHMLIRDFPVHGFLGSPWLRIAWFDSVAPVRVKHIYTEVLPKIMSTVAKMILVELDGWAASIESVATGHTQRVYAILS
jgi:hypothetical protein